jgi:hypothetical protein
MIMINWLSQHKFQAHVTAFLMMVLSAIGMIYANNPENVGATWILLGVFAIANGLAMVIK